MDINKKVLLLGILTRESDESLNDIVFKLEAAGVFSLKEGKKLLKDLKSDSLVVDGGLSIEGEIKAKEVQKEFTL